MFRKHINNKLMMYFDGLLSAEEKFVVENHVRECSSCKSEYDEIAFGKSLMQSLQVNTPPESIWIDIEKELSSRKILERKAQSRFIPKLIFATGALAIVIVAISYWALPTKPNNPIASPPLVSWKVSKISGEPKINGQQSDRIALGQTLTTDDNTTAQLNVGDIGSVKIDPNSQIQFLKHEENEHRLALNKGKITAFIWAPPGKFYVNTPSAVAVDLGCSYTLEVNDDGASILKVTMGWVAFERDGRESFIPADAECITRPNTGLGTPYFNDAPSALKEAINKFDTAGNDLSLRSSALNTILAKARKKDGLTLWHLLNRTDGSDKANVFDRFSKMIRLPKSITKDGILRGDKSLNDQIWDSLELGDTEWWRMWKKKD